MSWQPFGKSCKLLQRQSFRHSNNHPTDKMPRTTEEYQLVLGINYNVEKYDCVTDNHQNMVQMVTVRAMATKYMQVAKSL